MDKNFNTLYAGQRAGRSRMTNHSPTLFLKNVEHYQWEIVFKMTTGSVPEYLWFKNGDVWDLHLTNMIPVDKFGKPT
jgi:hypothetical protein